MKTNTESSPDAREPGYIERIVRLVVRQRSGDYHVQLDSDAKIWDCGQTADEAIARWVVTHGKEYGIEVVEPNDQGGAK